MKSIAKRMAEHRETVIGEYKRWFVHHKNSIDIAHFAQKLSAISKRTKAALVRDHLKEISMRMDLTPTAARDLTKKVTGRGIAELTLAELFGKSGRTAAEKCEYFTDLIYQEAVLKSPKIKAFGEEYRKLNREIARFNRERKAADWFELNVKANTYMY